MDHMSVMTHEGKLCPYIRRGEIALGTFHCFFSICHCREDTSGHSVHFGTEVCFSLQRLYDYEAAILLPEIIA